MFKIAVGVFAAHEQRDRFDSDFFALLNIDRLRAEAAPLDPALIHPQEHVGPIARLRSTGAGVNRHEGVRAIIFTREKLPQLEFFEFLHELRVLRRDFLFRRGARSRIGFLRGELLQRFEVVQGALQFLHRVDQPAQARDLLDFALGALAIRPEIRGRHPRFEFRQARLQLRQVKETSAVRRRARAILLR